MVLIDFWATWCPPCMAEADHLVAINREWGPKGLVLIGINMDTNARAMAAVCQQKGFNWPQYFEGRAWDNRIARAWGVRSIPSTFLISPEGVVLWKGHSAQLDLVLVEAFAKHPPQLVDPEVLAAANAAMDRAEALLAEDKPAEALKVLAGVNESASKDAAWAARAEAMRGKLLAHGQAVLKEADTLAGQKQYAPALLRLRELQQVFRGTPIADQARQRQQQLSADPAARATLAAAEREVKAAEALAAAQALAAEQKHEEAYVRLKQIARDHATTEAGASAAAAVADYEKDPAFVRKVLEETQGDQARAALSMAENYARNGRHDIARQRYQKIIDEYPGTSWAEQAQRQMDTLPR